MIYTVEELKKRIEPIAKRYELPTVYLFGSYARGEATDDSDVDILIDRSGSKVRTLVDFCGLNNDFEECIGKKVDLVTMQTLEQKRTKMRSAEFIQTVHSEKVVIYMEETDAAIAEAEAEYRRTGELHDAHEALVSLREKHFRKP